MQATIYTNTPWEALLNNSLVIPLVVTIMVGLLVIILATGLMCFMFLKALTGGGSTRARKTLQHREAQAFQELERGFRSMEHRLDSLETLLIGQPNRPITDRDLSQI